MLFTFSLLAASILSSPSYAAKAPEGEKPILESISGAKTVTLIHRAETREVSEGSAIEYGARIRTSELSTAMIAYPDGSKLAVNQNSELEIETRLDGTEWSKLRSGSVRGMITKPSESTNKLKLEGKPRFLIRSKSAVLGVRGTDFVMSLLANANEASVHTLEGVVEVAKDEASVLSGKGTLVSEGQFVQADVSGLSEVKGFSKAEFMNSYEGAGGQPAAGVEDLTGAQGGAPATPPASPGIPTLAGAPSPSFAAPAPTLRPPTAPPSVEPNKPDQQKEEEKKTTEALDNRRRIKLLSFQAKLLGMLLPPTMAPPFPTINDPNTQSLIPKLLTLSWDPSIPIPGVQFLSARGHVALGWALGPDWEPAFPAQFGEVQVFATLTFYKTFFLEGGMGFRRWGHKPESFDVPLQTLMGGLAIKGVVDRIFIGKSWQRDIPGGNGAPQLPLIQEFFAGVQFSFYGD